MLAPHLFSLWEIMKQFQPEKFMILLEFLTKTVREHVEDDGRVTPDALPHIKTNVLKLADLAGESGLVVSEVTARRAAIGLDAPSRNVSSQSARAVMEALEMTIENECKTMMFFSVEAERRRYFDRYREGWEEVIDRFPETLTDIEEMSKCYALGRYAGAVFHSVHADEHVLIELGKVIGVTDFKSGWTATANALDKIVKKRPEDRSAFEREHYSFLEQVHGTVEALKNAWRNKISHAQGRLMLMTVDFTPEVTEEIILATRSFCRRIATELPN